VPQYGQLVECSLYACNIALLCSRSNISHKAAHGLVSKVDLVPQYGQLVSPVRYTDCHTVSAVACIWIVFAVKLNQAMQWTAMYSARWTWCLSTASWMGAGGPACDWHVAHLSQDLTLCDAEDPRFAMSWTCATTQPGALGQWWHLDRLLKPGPLHVHVCPLTAHSSAVLALRWKAAMCLLMACCDRSCCLSCGAYKKRPPGCVGSLTP
jgi:hypothetical protein